MPYYGKSSDADLLDGHDSTYFAPLNSPVFTGRVTGPIGTGSSGGFGFDSDTGMVSSGDGNLKFYTNSVYAGGPITGTNTWDISITGSAGSTPVIYSPDGDRNAGTKLPTTTTRSVRYDFANGNTAGNPGSAYCGVMTYAPWDGTAVSTGSQSYQLSYGSNAQNTGTIPVLQIRNGIDSTWNQWYKIWHSGNGGSGSGLDADTVDGKHASDFVPAVGGLSQSASYLSMTGVSGNTCADLFANTSPGATSISQVFSCADAPITNGWWMIESIRHTNTSGQWGTQTAHGWQTNAGKMFERNIENGGWSSWRKVIVSANSGNVLIGTDSDNGVDKLQVNGSITVSGSINSKNRQVYNFFEIDDSNRVQTSSWYKLGTFSNSFPSFGASARINLRTGSGYNHNRSQRYYGNIDLRWGYSGGVEVSAAFSEGNIPIGYTANSDASSVDVYLNLDVISWALAQSYEIEILNGYSSLTWQNLASSNISGTPTNLVASNFVVVSTANNTVIGSIVDNGIDKLQVNGSISTAQQNGYITECGGYIPIIGDTSSVYAGSAGSIATVTDLNNLTRSGTYNGHDLTNAPVSGWIFVQHMQNAHVADGNWAQQIVTTMGAYNDPYRTFVRSKVNGTWGSWIERSINSVDGYVTRLNAIGTDNNFIGGGVQLRGNGTANTIKPTLGFHQPGLWAGTLNQEDANTFVFRKIDGSVANLILEALYQTNPRSSDGGRGYVTTNDPRGYSNATKFVTFQAGAEFYGVTQDYQQLGAELALVANQSSGNITFSTGTKGNTAAIGDANLAMRIQSNGNITIGTPIDNGIDKLQVSGSISTSPQNGYITECGGFTPIIGDTNPIFAGSAGSVATITDLNNLARPGTYNGQNLANAPVGGWIFVQHVRHSNINYPNDWAQQIVTTMGANNTANQMYIRTKTAGTWTSWVQK